MKQLLRYIPLAAIVLMIAGCSKKTEYTATSTFPNEKSTYLKVNYMVAYPTNPAVQLSVNGERVSGLITGRTPFPGGGFNTNGASFPDYLMLKEGVNTLSIAIPKRNTNIDSIQLSSTNLDLIRKRYYTAHVTDTGSKMKVVLMEDTLGFSDTTSRYRFVNMMPNVPLIDLYYGTTLIQTGIPYLGKSNYFNLAVPPATLAWTIRETGTAPTSTALATYTSSNTSQRGRIYTAFAMGYKGQTATATRPYISFMLNQ